MVRNEADAEDLTSETFLRAFEKRDQFQGRAAFSTWLHRVAVTTVLMWLRRKANWVQSIDAFLDADEHNDGSQKALLAAGGRGEREIDRVLFKSAMACLPASYRQAITLYDIEGYKHKEIAAFMGGSVSSSKARLRRARLRLHGSLRGHFPRQNESMGDEERGRLWTRACQKSS